ncbi:hypothetical protein F5883DRAFT_687350 [Diaporthe sp. PMI_573]|nr:hypothetical protein F5883DRAFT_687350 [Diaporthaceae sp. PMI_573]
MSAQGTSRRQRTKHAPVVSDQDLIIVRHLHAFFSENPGFPLFPRKGTDPDVLSDVHSLSHWRINDSTQEYERQPSPVFEEPPFPGHWGPVDPTVVRQTWHKVQKIIHKARSQGFFGGLTILPAAPFCQPQAEETSAQTYTSSEQDLSQPQRDLPTGDPPDYELSPFREVSPEVGPSLQGTKGRSQSKIDRRSRKSRSGRPPTSSSLPNSASTGNATADQDSSLASRNTRSGPTSSNSSETLRSFSENSSSAPAIEATDSHHPEAPDLRHQGQLQPPQPAYTTYSSRIPSGNSSLISVDSSAATAVPGHAEVASAVADTSVRQRSEATPLHSGQEPTPPMTDKARGKQPMRPPPQTTRGDSTLARASTSAREASSGTRGNAASARGRGTSTAPKRGRRTQSTGGSASRQDTSNQTITQGHTADSPNTRASSRRGRGSASGLVSQQGSRTRKSTRSKDPSGDPASSDIPSREDDPYEQPRSSTSRNYVSLLAESNDSNVRPDRGQSPLEDSDQGQSRRSRSRRQQIPAPNSSHSHPASTASHSRYESRLSFSSVAEDEDLGQQMMKVLHSISQKLDTVHERPEGRKPASGSETHVAQSRDAEGGHAPQQGQPLSSFPRLLRSINSTSRQS